jgi:hypothetical protein
MGCCKIYEWDEIRTNKLGDLNAYNWGTCSWYAQSSHIILFEISK